jgi:hypothetical protein
LQATLLKPLDDADAFNLANQGWWSWTRGEMSCRWIPKSQGRLAVRRQEIATCLTNLPPRERLEAMRQEMAAVARGPFNPDTTRAIIGLLVDSYPNARPHSPETYFEVLAHEIGVSGYSPHVVATGCAELVRSSVFLPSVAEVLSRCGRESERAKMYEQMFTQGVEAIDAWAQETEELNALRDLPEQDPPAPGRAERVPYGWRSEATKWREGDPIPF